MSREPKKPLPHEAGYMLCKDGPMSRPEKLPEVLDGNELASLLSSGHGHKATKLRNLAMIRLMENTGLGASEVLSIRVKDINFTDGTLKVRQGKGGKDRMLYLKDDDLNLIREYLGRRINTNDFVFVGKTQAGPSPLSPGHGETGRYPGGGLQRYQPAHPPPHVRH